MANAVKEKEDVTAMMGNKNVKTRMQKSQGIPEQQVN